MSTNNTYSSKRNMKGENVYTGKKSREVGKEDMTIEKCDIVILIEVITSW
jgi:hypothetical protein